MFLGFDALGQRAELHQFVGYMPEHDCLPLDMTATEFVAHMAQVSGLPRDAARERTAETLRHVGLFEERYRAMRGYSTGMKQRVKLAQALVHDPRHHAPRRSRRTASTRRAATTCSTWSGASARTSVSR